MSRIDSFDLFAVRGTVKSLLQHQNSKILVLFVLSFLYGPTLTSWFSQVAQMVKCLPAMQEIWVPSSGQEDPPKKEMATHSSTLAWKIPWMEEPGRL